MLKEWKWRREVAIWINERGNGWRFNFLKEKGVGVQLHKEVEEKNEKRREEEGGGGDEGRRRRKRIRRRRRSR